MVNVCNNPWNISRKCWLGELKKGECVMRHTLLGFLEAYCLVYLA